MKIIGVIPARFGSTRLPGKPLVNIKGKPMIQRVFEQSEKSKLLDKIIVATDDMRIYNAVNDFGGEAVMTSPDHTSGTDRICEAIQNVKCDIVVNIQGDEPFIHPGNIDDAVGPLIESKNLNVSTLAIRISDFNDLEDVNKVKVVVDRNNFALYFSRSCIPYHPKENSLQLFKTISYFKHIGLYVFRKNYLLKFSKMKQSPLEKIEKLEQLRILENGEKMKVVITNKNSVSIDTMEDLKLVD